ASEGGETIFLPGIALVGILNRRAPDLINKLRSRPITHRRSGDERTEHVIHEASTGEVFLNWNYYCVDRTSPQVSQLAEDFFSFLASDPEVQAACVPIGLRPGDAVLWKDDRLLHGRKAFNAETVGERFIWKCAVDVGVWRHERV